MLYDIVVRMGVNIQRHAGVGMPHEILKTFDVDAGLLHIGAEGVAQHMRGHLGEISAKRPRMLPLETPHEVLQMHSYFGFPGLIEEYKPGAAIYQHFHLGRGSILQDVFQGHIHCVCHGNGANTAFGLGAADKIGLVRRFGELPPHMNTAPVKVKIALGQPIQLTDTETCPQQDHHIIIVAATAVFHEELKVLFLLFPAQSSPHIGVTRNHIGQFELKRVLSQDVIVNSHFEGWADNALHHANGVLFIPAVMQGHKPAFCVRQLHMDLLLPKRVFPDTIDHRIIGPERILFQTPLQVHIPGDKLNHRHLPGGIVNPVHRVTLNIGFLLPQFLEGLGIDIPPLLVNIGVTEHIMAVIPLAFAGFQNTALLVSALFRQTQRSFLEKRSIGYGPIVPCDMRKFHLY